MQSQFRIPVGTSNFKDLVREAIATQSEIPQVFSIFFSPVRSGKSSKKLPTIDP